MLNQKLTNTLMPNYTPPTVDRIELDAETSVLTMSPL